MKTATIPALLAAMLLFAAPAFTQSGTIVLDPGQPTYEVGQRLNITVTTDPGNLVALLADLEPGPTLIPGIGTLHVGFSPNLKVFTYITPPSGTFLANCLILCDPVMFGLELHAQAVGFVPPTLNPILSNPIMVEFVPGDCTDVCEGGIHRLGLQTVLPGVAAAPGLLTIEARERTASGALVGDLSALIDPSSLPSLPLSNANGTVEVVRVEQIGNDLLVRFEVDARPTTLRHLRLPPETYFFASFETQQASQIIHTSCSVPIAVGSHFGPFIVTLLVDRS